MKRDIWEKIGRVGALAVVLLVGAPISAADSPELRATWTVMPWPTRLEAGAGRLVLDRSFAVSLVGHRDARLVSGLGRALRRLEERTGLEFARDDDGAYAVRPREQAILEIDVAAAGPAIPELGQDESYTLRIEKGRAVLRAVQVVGALRGLETWLQLLRWERDTWFFSDVMIEDRPRFPWRGLLIDVGRHWQSVESLKRSLDGMALVKMNVLHLHLTEDQSFRIECRAFPELHRQGSQGLYYTQEQMRELIAYAAERGIRVMPEFDVPGHTTSWLAALPQLGSGDAPQRYRPAPVFGIQDPTLDPTNEEVYGFLDRFIAEMAALFPDAYFHIGGDEVSGRQWTTSARIQQFIRERGLKDNHGLQAYFNLRLEKIVTKHGKHMIGWDEILHPDLPKNAIVHSWRGEKGVAEALGAGHGVLLSHGYYIDLGESAAQHYLVDPEPGERSPAAGPGVLGGEATMWGEWITEETIDSRIWPRTAAIAERLWSARDVRDVDDMYRRLAVVGRRLEEAGMRQDRDRAALLRRLAGDAVGREDFATLQRFCDLLEPYKRHRRMRLHRGATPFTPYTTLFDYAVPESEPAREFGRLVQRFAGAQDPQRAGMRADLEKILRRWSADAREAARIAEGTNPRFRHLAPLAVRFAEECDRLSSVLVAQAAGRKAEPPADPGLPKFPAGTVELGVDSAAWPHLRVLAAALRAERTLTADELTHHAAEYANLLRWP